MFNATIHETVSARLSSLAVNLRNFDQAFRSVRRLVEIATVSQFQPGNNNWRELTPGYKKRRRYPDRPILIQDRRLIESYKHAGAHEYGPTTYKYGSTVYYASYHQSAKDPRKLRPLDAKVLIPIIMKALQAHIMQK